MNTYPSTYSPAPLAQSQSTPNTSRGPSAPSSYPYSTPQQPSYNQTNYNNPTVGTRNQEPVRSPTASDPNAHRALMERMDSVLKQSQSPTRVFTSPERKDIPSFNQPNFQNQGVYTSPGYNYPLSSRSHTGGDSSPINLRQSINGDNNAFPKTENVPRRNYETSSYLSGPEQSYPQQSPYASTGNNNDMGDLKSRLSNLENQLNAIDMKSPTKDPYTAPIRQSAITSNYYPATRVPDTQPKRENHPVYPQASTYGAPANSNPRRDGEVSDQIVKKIDDLMNAHIFESRSPVRSGALSQRNHYASPTRDPYTSFSSPLYTSNVTPTVKPAYNDTTPSAKPAQKETIPTYQSTYDSRPAYDSYSTYEPYKPSEPRNNYHSSTTYEPLPKYESERKPYEPKYESDTKPHEPYKSYKSSYESLDYERENPYSSYFDKPATTNNYDNAPVHRQKYIRPLYRNTPEKYRPASSYTSDYVSPYSHDHHHHHHHDNNDRYDHHDPHHHHHSSVHSTPSKDHQDTNATDKKLKKLTLKSKPSDDREIEPVRFTKEPLHHHGTKRANSKGGDLVSDYEENALPLPRYDETAPNSQKKRAHNKLHWHHAGDLSRDESSLHYSSDEELMGEPVYHDHHEHYDYDNNYDHHDHHEPKKVNAMAPPHAADGLKIRSGNDFKAGNLLSDTNHHAGDLLDDEEVVQHNTTGHKKGTGMSNIPKKSDQQVYHHNAGALVTDGVPKKSDQQVHRHHAGGLISEGQPVKTRNVADDGKAWNMPHRLSSQVFEETDSSIFDFDEVDQKQSTRPTKQKNTKESLSRNPTHTKSASKGVIWDVEEPMNESRRRNDSMRRSDRKPVLTESFEKYGKMGY